MLVHRDSLAYQDPERVGVPLPGPLGLAAGLPVQRSALGRRNSEGVIVRWR